MSGFCWKRLLTFGLLVYSHLRRTVFIWVWRDLKDTRHFCRLYRNLGRVLYANCEFRVTCFLCSITLRIGSSSLLFEQSGLCNLAHHHHQFALMHELIWSFRNQLISSAFAMSLSILLWLFRSLSRLNEWCKFWNLIVALSLNLTVLSGGNSVMKQCFQVTFVMTFSGTYDRRHK